MRVTETTWLDRAIAWFAPGRGAMRAQNRITLAAMLAYEGARGGRRDEGWSRANTSADAEISAYGKGLRASASDLVRNNPHAAKAVEVAVTNMIGTGIMSNANGPNRRLNKQLDDRFKRWADICDLTGKTDWYGIQAQAERTRFERGEALIRYVQVRIGDAREIPIRLQVLEPDFIDDSINRETPDGNQVKEGIEYDSKGRVVAYYLFDQHPGDSWVPRAFNSQASRISASQVLHYYKPLRAGQTRGVSAFAPIVRRLHDLDDYDDAEVMRKKIAACTVAWVTTPQGLPAGSLGATRVDSDGRRVEQMHPGMIAYGKPGETATFNDPKPSGDYREFMTVQLHAIASGLKMPYELLTNDLVEVNYSSARVGLIQYQNGIEQDQWQFVIPQLVRPVWERFVFEASGSDGRIARDTPAVFTPPRVRLLDPSKEIPPIVQSLESGVESYPNLQRSLGYDWREKLDEIEEFQKEAKSRGVLLSSIPKEEPKSAPPPSPQDAPAPPPDDRAAA